MPRRARPPANAPARRCGIALLAAALVAAAAAPARAAAPAPAAEGAPLYGHPTGTPKAVQRARPAGSAPDNWRKAPFFVIRTDLSPATLYHSTTKYLGFFADMKESGLGGPTYAAYASAGHPRVVKAGADLDTGAMSECWILVWFAGAEGWADWDSPWVVYLQKRPRSIRFGADGLALRFNGAAGFAVLMPLYGCYKPPQQGKEFLAAHGLPAKRIETWTWAGGLPAGVAARVRYWANVSREFPLYGEDSFSVDRAADAVVIRQKFQWVSIADDWETPHLKLAPLSPPLALASMDGEFPVTYSRPPVDPWMPTPCGPYMGVENVDEFDATLRVLGYVHETEGCDLPAADAHPTVRAALERLRETARRKFPSADRYDADPGGPAPFGQAVQGDAWYAKGLPYYDDQIRARAVAGLRKRFREDVLVPARFTEREHPEGSGRTYAVLKDPGPGSSDDAGRSGTNLLEPLWAYAHFTGNWALLEERWDLVQRLFGGPAGTHWNTFGREGVAEMGDGAAPCLATARMAYKVGDMDTYGYACYLFARELVLHGARQRGGPYVRLNQPWHSLEAMPEEVYLTHLGAGGAGWQIDGPAYPAGAAVRRYADRWVRFASEDVARFCREHLSGDVRREMDLLAARWGADPALAARRRASEPHGMPSLVQLRSLLLDEPPERLADLATPDKFDGPPSGVIASCIAVLRTSHPARLERLIPKAGVSAFVAGLEREVDRPGAGLAEGAPSSDAAQESRPVWPTAAAGWGWKTPAGRRWSFGRVRADPTAMPVAAESVPLNWNTEAVAYRLP